MTRCPSCGEQLAKIGKWRPNQLPFLRLIHRFHARLRDGIPVAREDLFEFVMGFPIFLNTIDADTNADQSFWVGQSNFPTEQVLPVPLKLERRLEQTAIFTIAPNEELRRLNASIGHAAEAGRVENYADGVGILPILGEALAG